jgi:hypothetical protein
MNMENLEAKTLSQLARLIQQDWKKINYAAAPYLDAMRQLESVDAAYGYDSGRSIVRYFLGNAGSWRGDVAKVVKTELKRRTA